MADRLAGRTATIYADVPGAAGESVTVSITDPIGELVLQNGTATHLAASRYQVQTPRLIRSGVWTAVWSSPLAGDYEQLFTVGPQEGHLFTYFDLVVQTLSRVDKTMIGEMMTSAPGVALDPTLLGSAGNYVSWWVMLAPPLKEQGVLRRVVGFNGEAMELSSPFNLTTPEGAQYCLSRIDPREAMRSLESAFAEVRDIARIPVGVLSVPVVDGIASVPAGLTIVTGIYVDGVELGPEEWALRPGRAVSVPDTATQIDIFGSRDAMAPAFMDSLVELDPLPLMARASVTLHAMRAAGQGVDVEEHLRRQLVASQEFNDSLRRAAGRVRNGSREVI